MVTQDPNLLLESNGTYIQKEKEMNKVQRNPDDYRKESVKSQNINIDSNGRVSIGGPTSSNTAHCGCEKLKKMNRDAM